MGTNGSTIAALSGCGLIHRHFDKRQLACIGADVKEGLITIKWSVAQLATVLNVNRVYIDLARTFSAEKRAAIISGRDMTSFVALLKAPEPQLTLPLTNGKSDDAEIVAVVQKYGTTRVLDACVAAEIAQ
jgi:hypothetical protein